MFTIISLLTLWVVVIVSWWRNREETQRLTEKVAELSGEVDQLRKGSKAQ